MKWLKKIFSALSKKERIMFVIASLGAIVSFVVVMGFVITQATKAVPAEGGEYTEGMLGQPEYINPVIATSQADLDLVKLLYSNLASVSDSITPSPNLQTWDVRLKEGLTWQDGQKLTSDDVVFTVQSIQNTDANSPLYQSWQGVSASRVSELEVEFTLANPYAFFGDNLKNLYILPKHIFADTPPGNWHLSDYNLKPIGSGPYKFLGYDKTADGYISTYHLQEWKGSANGDPLIHDFNLAFFTDENALVQSFNSGQIDGFGNASTDDIATINRPHDTFSWRTSGYYAIFFNQSKNLALQDPIVRQALSAAIDRNDLINAALGGAGVPEYGPIPPDAAHSTDVTPSSTASTPSAAASLAASILDGGGWTMDSSTLRSKTILRSSIPLVVNLTVPQIGFLAKTADYLRNAWQAIGVQANVTMDSPGAILNDAVTNRNYEGLLFGNVLGPSSDLYSFWDSSQDFTPGLNLSIYKSASVDSLIEAARQASGDATTTQDLVKAQTKIAGDYPAIFLYSPDYVYVTNKNVQGVNPGLLSDPSDRFLEVVHWYLNTARVLK